MKKYVVLGVNENPVYLYYIPLVKWAWNKLGWEEIIFYHAKNLYAARLQTPIEQLVFKVSDFVYGLFNIEGYKSETIAQVSRLYAAAVIDQGYLMTTDADMLPLSDYWFPNIGLIDCYGRDLTDYHYPICYIGMEAYLWQKVMNIPEWQLYGQKPVDDFLRRDLRHQRNEWTLDQDIITEELVKYQINREDRGTDKRTGYPIGRVDRSAWRLDHEVYIDAHLPHDILTNENSFHNVMELLHKIWPGEDFKWVVEYHKEFKKLL